MHTLDESNIMKLIILVTILIISVQCQTKPELSETCRKFSMELIYHTAKETHNHTVISPFGIWTLMSSISFGATGNTYQQLKRALRLPGTKADVAKGMKKLNDAVLNPSGPEVNLTSKNLMFVDHNFQVNEAFKTFSRTELEAEIIMLDFKKPDVAKTANDIIKNTGANVFNVLTSDDFMDSRMILTNVLTFKGLWKLPFEKVNTQIEPFYNENKEQLGNVNMMSNRVEIPFTNLRDLKCSAVELEYGNKGEYSMLLVLPYSGHTAIDVYMKLGSTGLTRVFESLENDTKAYGISDVDIKIPRFQISTNVVLNKPLNNMGIYDVFDPNYADFQVISKDPVYVSTIVHKAEIEVTEAGTDASAISSASFADRTYPPKFEANRPFIYFIVERKTTTIIFGGIYSQPSVF